MYTFERLKSQVASLTNLWFLLHTDDEKWIVRKKMYIYIVMYIITHEAIWH